MQPGDAVQTVDGAGVVVEDNGGSFLDVRISKGIYAGRLLSMDRGDVWPAEGKVWPPPLETK